MGHDIAFTEDAEFNDYIIVVETNTVFLTLYLNLNVRLNICINIRNK